MNRLISIDEMSAAYGKRQVLHDISMEISFGDKLLLVGPNGSGKTTLLKSIIGLIPLQNGLIEYLGEDITNSSVRTRVRKGLGYLLQTGNIVPGLTVEENLDLGGFLLNKRDLDKRKELVLDSISFLKEKLQKRAGVLSGGERQSLALSMVMMRSPKVLLLDEPSAGLAPKAANKILESVESLQESFGVESVCMVEHNLKLALPWANKVSVLVQGHLCLNSDQPEKFVKDPKELESYYFN